VRGQLVLDLPINPLDLLDVDRADRVTAEELAAEIAAAARPRFCRCEPRPVPWTDEDGAVSCVLCGRSVA
jgi:hypothetical protein